MDAQEVMHMTFASLLRLISRPNAWKSSRLSSWYILISPYIILHFRFVYENEIQFYDK